MNTITTEYHPITGQKQTVISTNNTQHIFNHENSICNLSPLFTPRYNTWRNSNINTTTNNKFSRTLKDLERGFSRGNDISNAYPETSITGMIINGLRNLLN